MAYTSDDGHSSLPTQTGAVASATRPGKGTGVQAMVFTGKVMSGGSVILRAATVMCFRACRPGATLPSWRGEFGTPTPGPLFYVVGEACTIVRDDGAALHIVITGFRGSYAVAFE